MVGIGCFNPVFNTDALAFSLFPAFFSKPGLAEYSVKGCDRRQPLIGIFIRVYFPYFFLGGLVVDLLRAKNPMRRYREYYKIRGMSALTDWCDWLGGYPFEVAKPEEIFDFYKAKGYRLERLKTCAGGLGNNEFVFRLPASP